MKLTRTSIFVVVYSGIFPCFIPPKNTDVLAPVDHHAGNRLKRDMSSLKKADLERNDREWCNPPDQGGLRQKRVKLAFWLATAWDSLRNDASFIRSTFVATGWLIAKDGSENNLIKVPGIANYDFTSSINFLSHK